MGSRTLPTNNTTTTTTALTTTTPAMARLVVTSVLMMATATMAAPQLEGLKGLLSTLSGDDQPGEVNGDYEQVPYTTIQKFNVSNTFREGPIKVCGSFFL